jgi:hypothetical protein
MAGGDELMVGFQDAPNPDLLRLFVRKFIAA